MMEMNYMLSYGAAHSSLLLLKKFNLLEMLLPYQVSSGIRLFSCTANGHRVKMSDCLHAFQAAYLADHSVGQTPTMLMVCLQLSNNNINMSSTMNCFSFLLVCKHCSVHEHHLMHIKGRDVAALYISSNWEVDR